MSEFYCSECLKPCEVVTEECGIGGYEYQGEVGHDIRYADVSDCCGAPVLSQSDFDEQREEER